MKCMPGVNMDDIHRYGDDASTEICYEDSSLPRAGTRYKGLLALRTFVLMIQVRIVIRQMEACVFAQHQSCHDKEDKKYCKCSHFYTLLAGILLWNIYLQPSHIDY